MKTYAYGLPRIGGQREFKKSVELFWSDTFSKDDLFKTIFKIQEENNQKYNRNVDCFPDSEMSLYDPMLDMALLFGLFEVGDVSSYYQLCRDEFAFEMKKWFNTNYHYLISDFEHLKDKPFRLQWDHFSLLGKNQAKCPSLIGPFTFLKLSKGLSARAFEKRFFELIPLYQKIFQKMSLVHIEEPAFAFDLEVKEIQMIKEGYSSFEEDSSKIILMTYYDSIDWMDTLLELPFFALGLDFVRGKKSFNAIVDQGFPSEKILIAGLIDGRNVWKTNFTESFEKIKQLRKKVKNLWVSNGAPLFHLPVSLSGESSLNPFLKSKLAFSDEKLKEIAYLGAGGSDVEKIKSSPEDDEAFQNCYGLDLKVSKRVDCLVKEDFEKTVSLKKRREIQNKILQFPLFPTTTIGSFPQTKDVRRKRLLYRKGELSKKEYKAFIRSKIDEVIAFQENLDLDVFVHGEFERTDMVEFFAKNLDGIATTEQGWVLSYGTRVYRPPLIYGDVKRSESLSVEEIAYAQGKTSKPVKGMLTGPVTIIAWSFCREDIPIHKVAYQISLAIKDEIEEYEKKGISVVQVDEAAFREMVPLKKRDWATYFDWAVKSFNLATRTRPETQIHTHMCYSKFVEIIDFIKKMDFDVISIEASKSRGEILSAFEGIDFEAQIGLGVWDIHSTAVAKKENISDILERSLKNIPSQNFWLNPDCGLKTRGWDETEKSLKALVSVAKAYRKNQQIDASSSDDTK